MKGGRSHSIFRRITLGATLVSILLVALLWALADWTVRASGDAALERAVDVDLAGLADIYASGGEADLIARIEDRLMLTSSGENPTHYLLQGAGNRRLAGDLDQWPGLNARTSQSGRIALPDGGEAHARATQLAPGVRLVVAREDRTTAALVWRLAMGFFLAGLAAVAAVALLGWLTTQRLGRRIERINEAFRRREPAAIAALGQHDSARDEIGELTRHSGDALEQTTRLAQAHRDTADQLAHEIRTPLMHLDTKLVKLARGSADPAMAAALAGARGDIRNLVALLESLLDIAASEARIGDRSGLKPVDLSTMTRRIAELYADNAEESGHRFDFAIAPGVTIPGEEMQLARLMTNLLDNAFKYVPAGESIRLSLDKGPRLSVADTGPGVPEDERAMIFDRFRRGNGTAHLGAGQDGAGRSGAGLGLALARAIAQRHGLNLSLAPSDQGAHFLLEPEARR